MFVHELFGKNEDFQNKKLSQRKENDMCDHKSMYKLECGHYENLSNGFCNLLLKAHMCFLLFVPENSRRAFMLANRGSSQPSVSNRADVQYLSTWTISALIHSSSIIFPLSISLLTYGSAPASSSLCRVCDGLPGHERTLMQTHRCLCSDRCGIFGD